MTETFRQWRERHIAETMAKYECSRQMGEECWPEASALSEWTQAVEQAADHNRLPNNVLDSFLRECGHDAFCRTFRGRLEQEGYRVPPRFLLARRGEAGITRRREDRHMEIQWDVSKKDAKVIAEITNRAAAIFAKHDAPFDRTQFAMDVTAVHRNGCPLKLRDLLASEAFDFSHDIEGIQRHIDRSTGRLGGEFLPRCAAQ